MKTVTYENIEIELKALAEAAIVEAKERIGFYKDEIALAETTLRDEMNLIAEFSRKSKEAKKEIIENFRGMRMTTTTEVAAMLKPLEDLRKFFLGAEHDKEIARLREFVDLCERLETLKKSGFLDTVADTMLKLS